MAKLIYVIKDKIIDEVSTIFIANNNNHARMIFENSLKAAKKAGYESEFVLLLVGTIEMDTAEVDYVSPPQVIGALQQDFDFEEGDK